jgi:Fe-S-cluster containining protein
MAVDSPATVSLYQQQTPECLSLDSRFKFQCHPGLDCFNRCCQNPTIALSPYDVLRLKQVLGLTSGEFLRRFTVEVVEEASSLPLIFLDPTGGCPFVGPGGCTVYDQRPAACRLFPLTMGSQLTEQGVVDHYFYRRLDFCRGFEGEAVWTVTSWQADQGFAEFDRERRFWLEILLLAGLRQIQVDARLRELVYTAAYDLDAFRRRLAAPGWQQAHHLNQRTLRELQQDDLALLRFCGSYLKKLLFPDGS